MESMAAALELKKDPCVTPCHVDQRGKGEPSPKLEFRNLV